MNIKLKVKKICGDILAREIDINNLAKCNYKCISFDIFDTLIVRCVDKPTDIFVLVENEYNRKHPENSISNFKIKRVAAEKAAREASEYEEVTLDDIYERLDFSNKNDLKECELAIEYLFCEANKELKPIYDQLIAQSVCVVITSDMYLPESFVRKLLYRCGYVGYAELYLSSVKRATKRSSHLFEQILQEQNISARELLHVGDDFAADFLGAKKCGINSILYRENKRLLNWEAENKIKRNFSNVTAFKCDILNCFIRRNYAEKDLYKNVGYEVFGPILLGYSYWMRRNLEKRGCDVLFFLAREGSIFKTAWEILYPDCDLATRYIYISRLSVCRANLALAQNWDEMYNTMQTLSRHVRTVRDFAELTGAFCANDDNKLLSAGVNPDTFLSDFCDKEALYKVIKKYGDEYFREQSRLIHQYLEDSGINNGKIAVSDVGWSGTMQAEMQQMFPDANLEGYYIGVTNLRTQGKYATIARSGYWFDDNGLDSNSLNAQKERFTNLNFEQLFLSDEQSTIGYAMSDKNIYPVKANQENSVDVVAKIKSMQSSAYKFLKDIREAGLDKMIGDWMADNPDLAFANYERFAVYPKAETVKFYKDMVNLDGDDIIPMIDEYGLVYSAFHPKKQLVTLSRNTGKIIYLKSLLKLPLPYFELLKFAEEKLRLKTEFRKEAEQSERIAANK